MKRFILTVLLLFSLSFTAPSQISTEDSQAVIEQVERVGRWSARDFTVFGIVSVIAVGSIFINFRQDRRIRKLNEKIEVNLKDHTIGEIEVVYKTLEKYSDLAMTQKKDAEKIIDGVTEVLTILKNKDNGQI